MVVIDMVRCGMSSRIVVCLTDCAPLPAITYRLEDKWVASPGVGNSAQPCCIRGIGAPAADVGVTADGRRDQDFRTVLNIQGSSTKQLTQRPPYTMIN